jgi:hypothetical protein
MKVSIEMLKKCFEAVIKESENFEGKEFNVESVDLYWMILKGGNRYISKGQSDNKYEAGLNSFFDDMARLQEICSSPDADDVGPWDLITLGNVLITIGENTSSYSDKKD